MTVPLRRLVRLVTQCLDRGPRPFVALENLASGTGRLMDAGGLVDRDLPEAGAAAVEPGTVLFGKLRPYLVKSWLVDRPVYASTELLALEPGRDVESRWLGYVCLSTPFVEWAVATSDGAKMPRTSWAKLGEFRLDVPTLTVQHEIADFLDAETARIDALIEKKRRMMELLRIRARETVARLVLRGVLEHELTPSRSGLLGLVPASWNETQLRHLGFTVQTGPFGSQLHASDYIENGWPVINPANLVDGTVRADPRVSITDEKRTELHTHVLRADDLIMGRRGEMGRVALVTEAQEGWICGTGCLRITARQARLDPRYLLLLLRTPALRVHLSLSSVGSTMENLNAEIVLSAPTLIPPDGEQQQIVELARRASDVNAELIARIDNQLVLLSEHRQALITAAVTGQLDVSRAAA